MKLLSVVFLFSLGSILSVLANNSDLETIIKQPAGLELLYAESLSDPSSTILDMGSIFKVSATTHLEAGMTLEPGQFIQAGEWIENGMLTYTGFEPIKLFLNTENGQQVITVYPGETVVVGLVPPGGEYCDYCRCLCTRNTVNKLEQITEIGIDPVPVQTTKAYFPWTNETECTARNGGACETAGGFSGTLGSCTKISRLCF